MPDEILEARAIRLKDKSGATRIMLEADDSAGSGFASITLFSKTLHRSVHMSAQADDSVEVGVRGRHGLANASLAMGSDDGASLTISDGEGKPILCLGICWMASGDKTSLCLLRDGKVVLELPEAMQAGAE
jgi:hypothetical protein